MTTQTTNYINLHAQGIGFLKRVREVKLNKGRKTSFWSADISMMHGETGVDNGITYVQFQVNPANQECADIIQHYAEQANSSDFSVRIGARVSDFFPETFTLTKGANAGQIRTVLKGRLLLIFNVWVKDKRHPNAQFELVYERPRADVPAQNESQDESQEASA